MDALLGASPSPTNLLPHSTPLGAAKPVFLPLSRHVFDDTNFASESLVSRNILLLGRPYSLRPLLAAKSVGLALAHNVLDEMPHWDTFAWNTLIQTHLSAGDLRHVVFIYLQMLHRGIRVDGKTLPRVLSALSRLSARLSAGQQVHAQAVKLGFSHDQYVVTALLDMYGNLDSVETAKRLATCPVAWTLLVRLYLKKGKPGPALSAFHEMVRSGAELDRVAMATGIGAAAKTRSLEEGRKIHAIAADHKLDRDVLVSNSLLKMYIDCGSVGEARETFDRMHSRDLISWTEIVQAYVKAGEYNEAIKLFRRMVEEGLEPDPLSVSSVLPACARMAENKHAREIHAHSLRRDVELNLHVLNALLDAYAKSGSIEYASRVFSRLKRRDAISWTMMISGLGLHGDGELGLESFRNMERELGEARTDQIAYAAALQACVVSRSLGEGKAIFGRVKAPKILHCILMVSLLAGSGLFDEAMGFIRERRLERNPEVLRAVLDGCRTRRNSNLGKLVVEMLYEHEPLNAENYVMLSNWYAENSMPEKVVEIKRTVEDMGLKPERAFSWIEFRNKVHVFGTGDSSHPRSERIYGELESLMKRMEERGVKPGVEAADYSLHNVDGERECMEVGHSEMLAISFGLVSTEIGTTVRVTKNHRVCQFCHESAKGISLVTGREIVLKDPNRFHHFRGGLCSCGDFW